jgi:hypothetical protein
MYEAKMNFNSKYKLIRRQGDKYGYKSLLVILELNVYVLLNRRFERCSIALTGNVHTIEAHQFSTKHVHKAS